MDGAAVRDAVEDARRVADELQTLIGRLEAASSHGTGSSSTAPPTIPMAERSSTGSIAAA
jgi:hypothetical protein